MQKKNKCFLIFRGCLMLTVLLLCGCGGKNDLVIETSSEELSGNVAAASEPAEDLPEQDLSEEAEPAPIYVQVSGAVRSPGVYEMPAGSRVFEAIQKAGGMTDDAAAESLNQALEVTDGQMLVLYTMQEWEKMQGGKEDLSAGHGAEPDDGRVNINTAGIEELCTISGIGKSRAESIVTYREQNGAFEHIEDIMKVSGIKEGLFQKIKDKIKI